MYDEVGGYRFFERLVDAFYARVDVDTQLRPMYPDDLQDSKRHLTLFLSQYWGGPTTYFDERGHPRLRLRHVPFRIDRSTRDSWLCAMDGALNEVRDELDDQQYATLRDYFQMVANQLRNV